MTKLLDHALETVRGLPPACEDEVARASCVLHGRARTSRKRSPRHLPDVLEGLAEASRGEFATDEEVAAAFRCFEQ